MTNWMYRIWFQSLQYAQAKQLYFQSQAMVHWNAYCFSNHIFCVLDIVILPFFSMKCVGMQQKSKTSKMKILFNVMQSVRRAPLCVIFQLYF